ncbi:unnamed protein product [Debaryomyces tyrocola]|nr:unnamed protein product [Debaryomyces tyrocola]
MKYIVCQRPLKISCNNKFNQATRFCALKE